MAASKTILKLQNGNVLIVHNEFRQTVLNPQASLYREDETLFVTDCCGVKDEFQANQIISVTRKDSTVVPINGNMDLLFSELSTYFFFRVTGSGGSGAGVQSIIPGTDISVDNTDPSNPIVSYTGDQGLKDVSILLNTNQLVYADASPAEINPNGFAGWYFINNLPAKKINWYFFGPSLNVSIALSELNSLYCVANLNSNNELFFFTVYTRRQNDGNDAGSFYRSRITYANYVDTPNTINDHVFWAISDPEVNPALTDFEMTYDASTSVGPQLGTEGILFIALSTNSGAVVNDVEFTAKNLGIKLESLHQNILEAYPVTQPKYFFDKRAFLERTGQTTIGLANTQNLIYEKYLANLFTPSQDGRYVVGSWFIWSTNSTAQNILVRLRIVQQGGGLDETILLEQENNDQGGAGEVVNVIQAGNIVGNVNSDTDQRIHSVIRQNFDLIGGQTYDLYLEFTAPPGSIPTIYDGNLFVEQKTSV